MEKGKILGLHFKAGRKRHEGQERSKAANKLNSHVILHDCVTLPDEPVLTKLRNMKIIEYLRENRLLGNKLGNKTHKKRTKWQKRKARLSYSWKKVLEGTTFDNDDLR